DPRDDAVQCREQRALLHSVENLRKFRDLRDGGEGGSLRGGAETPMNPPYSRATLAASTTSRLPLLSAVFIRLPGFAALASAMSLRMSLASSGFVSHECVASSRHAF